MEKNINVILSPMSHCSARAEMPRSSRRRARGGRGRAQGTPKAAHSGSCCLPTPAPMPFPSPRLGTPVVWGHRWPGDNFPGPGRQGRNLHLYLHFLIAPAGFLGQRLALVSMAGFVRTPRTEGGTKGPQWTCHSPTSKAAGGAGRGHRGRGHRGWGHRSLSPLAQPTPGRTQGAPRAGEEAGGQPTLAGRWWFRHCRNSIGDTTPAGLLNGGAESQPPSPGGGSCPVPIEAAQEPDPDVPPGPLSRYFQPAFHPAGVGFFPLPTSLFHLGTVLPARLPAHARLAHRHARSAPALTPGDQQASQNHDQGLGKPGPQTAAASPVPPSRSKAPANAPPHPGHGDGDAAAPATPQERGPITASHTCEGLRVITSSIFLLV